MDNRLCARFLTHNRGMLQLDPAHPPLWRTPDCLQFGPDAVALLEHPDRWQQRMIQELERGLPETALDPVAIALGGTARRARELVALLEPALRGTANSPLAPVAVRALGPGLVPVARDVARGLREAGVVLVDDAHGAAAVTVLVAAHIVDPAAVAPLMSGDRPHLPIIARAGSMTIGPFVRPGATACLQCLQATRCDADPTWPAVATQLLSLEAPSCPAGTGMEAGLAAARLLSAPDAPDGTVLSVTLHDAALRRTWRAHRPHADCGCRSPAGSGNPHEVSDPIPAPTTATAIAQPA